MSKPNAAPKAPRAPKAPKAPAVAPVAVFTPPGKVAAADRKGSSTCAYPVATTWMACLAAPEGATRAQLTALAIAAGAAYYTARTQVDKYLRWARGGRVVADLPKGITLKA